MNKGITISVKDAIIFERLLAQNRDSAKLQKITECSYLESINLLNKLNEKLGRLK